MLVDVESFVFWGKSVGGNGELRLRLRLGLGIYWGGPTEGHTRAFSFFFFGVEG